MRELKFVLFPPELPVHPTLTHPRVVGGVLLTLGQEGVADRVIANIRFAPLCRIPFPLSILKTTPLKAVP